MFFECGSDVKPALETLSNAEYEWDKWDSIQVFKNEQRRICSRKPSENELIWSACICMSYLFKKIACHKFILCILENFVTHNFINKRNKERMYCTFIAFQGGSHSLLRKPTGRLTIQKNKSFMITSFNCRSCCDVSLTWTKIFDDVTKMFQAWSSDHQVSLEKQL